MTPVQRSEASRQAILKAALELVEEVGYAKLSIEGIAARAGVGKQTIYRWWPSKGAVLFDAVLDLAEADGDAALPDTGDLEADLKLVLRATVDEFNDPRRDRLLRALALEIAGDPALAKLYAERLDGPLHERKKARLRSAGLRRRPRRRRGADLVTARPALAQPRPAHPRVRRRARRDRARGPASTPIARRPRTTRPTAAIATASPSSSRAGPVASAETTGMPSVMPTCWLSDVSPVARPCS